MKRLEKQFISFQAFHRTPGGRVRETTVGERLGPRILETFDPVAQEIYRLLSAMNHKQQEQQSPSKINQACIQRRTSAAEQTSG
jgi:molybdenum-dependent DNA-binding transcriptional regulator ModE